MRDIYQIQYNLIMSQEANKFIEKYETETFSKFLGFQEDSGFQNKDLCNTRLSQFL